MRWKVPDRATAAISTAKLVDYGIVAADDDLLTSMLCREDSDLRNDAVDRIISLRDGSEFGDSSVRPFHPPKLNMKASTIAELIKWDDVTVSESTLACELTIDDLNGLRGSKLLIPKYPSHTQAVERLIRELTNACWYISPVYSWC